MKYSGMMPKAVLAFALVALAGVPAQATIYWVDDDTCPGYGSGIPGDPYCSIQSGIDAASAGDTVKVAAGTYFETVTMKSGVAIQGAGQGVSVIDGGAGGSVVTAVDVDSTATLDGFTITNGGSTLYGGGMYNQNSSPTVSNCTFSENSTEIISIGKGGGMFNVNSSPTVTRCTFSGNDAGASGGGMYNSGSSPVVTDCTFSDNTAVMVGSGGGIYNASHSSVALTRCSFSGNSTTNVGGAMFNDLSTVTVVDSTFFQNAASEVGGVYHMGGDSSLTMVNCVFYENRVDSTSIGVDISNYAALTITNCTFGSDSEPVIYNEIYDTSTTASVTNSIFREELISPIHNQNPSSPVVVTYSLLTAYSGTGNISGDPKFVDVANGDLHLQPDSPAIDAGNNAAPGLTVTDLDGSPRRFDDPDVVDTGSGTPPIVDMGAYELTPGLLFCDGFEWGDCSRWSKSVGEVS